MKYPFKPVTAIIILSILIATGSCKKEYTPPETPRTVRYKLYTEENFAGNDRMITFELWMRRRNGTTPLYDSLLAPMKISEIPDKAHAIVVDKVVPPGNNDVDIQLEFVYTIQNVGMSWYIDSLKIGEPSHTIEYSFK